MIQLLNDWVKKKKNNKIIDFLYAIFSVAYLLVLLSFFVLPFLGRIEITRFSFIIVWYISCLAILDLVITMIIKSDKKKEMLISVPVVLCILSFFILSFVGSYFVQEITFLKALFYSAIGLICIVVLAIILKSTNVYSKSLVKSKQAYANKVIGVGLLIVLITFILSIKYNATIAIYSLGIALSCYLLFNAYSNFQKWTDKQVAPFIKLFTFVDFLCGVGIGIYLIYSIKDAVLQNIITIIIAAMIGGIITLLGVAMTIRYQNEKRIEEEKNKAKPQIIFSSSIPNYSKYYDVEFAIKSLPKKAKTGIEDLTNRFVISLFRIYVTDKADAICKKMIINDIVYEIDTHKILQKDNYCYIKNNDIEILYDKNNPKDIFIVIEDLLGNEYLYQLIGTYERLTTKQTEFVANNIKYQGLYDKSKFKEEPNET